MLSKNKIKLIDLIKAIDVDNFITIYVYYGGKFIAYAPTLCIECDERDKYIRRFRIDPVLIGSKIKFNMTVFMYD